MRLLYSDSINSSYDIIIALQRDVKYCSAAALTVLFLLFGSAKSASKDFLYH